MAAPSVAPKVATTVVKTVAHSVACSADMLAEQKGNLTAVPKVAQSVEQRFVCLVVDLVASMAARLDASTAVHWAVR